MTKRTFKHGFLVAAAVSALHCSSAPPEGATASEADDLDATPKELGDPGATCAASHATADPDFEAQLADPESPVSKAAVAAASKKSSVGVVYHILAPRRSHPANLTSAQIKWHIATLNKGWAGMPFTFHLAAVTRTYSSDWFYHGFNDEKVKVKIEKRLHRGNTMTMNVWSTSTGGAGVSSFPGGTLYSDGMFIPWQATKTIIHETGHWMSLFHTFEGGCSSPGDHVSDTPPSQQTSGCAAYDTCRGGGADPIHNFMSYNCGTHFTRGQSDRSVGGWVTRVIGSIFSSAKTAEAAPFSAAQAPHPDDLAWVDEPPAPGDEPWPETELEVISDGD